MRDGWIETNLGKYIQINTGKLDVNAASEFGEYPFFTCSRETYRIDEAAFEGESVLVAGNGDLNVKYFDGKFNAYQRTYVLNSVDRRILDNRFLFLYMQTYIEYLRSETRGTVIQYLKKGQFTDAKIKLPPLPEQKRIVDLISSVDSYIEALQQQLETAKRSRNAVLHELLTAGGDEWVETNLGLVSEFIMGQAPLGERCNKDGIGTPFVKAGEFDENRPKIVEWTTDPLKMAKSSDVLVCVVGATAGKINLGADCAIGRSVAAVRPGQELSQFFLYYLLSLELSNLRSGSRGSAQGVITKDDLHRIAVNLPPLTEQERIIEIISSMDKVADQTQLAITEAQNLRSGLLSDLLSGEHEIPASYDKVIGAA
jgi:restriction endonuclease S subunit